MATSTFGPTGLPDRSDTRQATIGLLLAGALASAWAACHVWGVFFHPWTPLGLLTAPVLVALQCWLNVGLFIVAHDCMHGSLAPFRPRLNKLVGRVCVALYAGFSYDRLIGKHFAHHRHSGTELDPDFNADGPRRFWPWYVAFFGRYFGLRELGVLAGLLFVYIVLLRARPENTLLFWGLPAILSSIQLFYFGTFLPHRHEDESFADGHNARSNDFSWVVSLLTCFHFGYHHEHHEMPNVPWWKLPAARMPASAGQAGLTYRPDGRGGSAEGDRCSKA